MTLLGIDVGTTHLKVGAFDPAGATRHLASRTMVTHRAAAGYAYYDPEEVWGAVVSALEEAAAAAPGPIRAIGIASMAETGLLIHRKGGQIRSEMLPWFDLTAQGQADALAAQGDPQARFLRTGLQISSKCSVARLLWLQERDPAALEGTVWLSTADYIAYRLTGAFATDYSLASRTCAFDIEQRVWDADWLQSLGLPPDIFAPAFLAGQPVGTTRSTGPGIPAGIPAGILAGVPVAVCGHDHVCGALGAGAFAPGMVFDSMGTAEALIGAMPARPLTGADVDAGLMVGCHVIPGSHYWMGGLSASGGAVEWLRRQLGRDLLSYDELLALLDAAPAGPTGILFFPYLLGSGSPNRDAAVRAAWIGLSAAHTRADLAKAVLEGTAYEMAYIQNVGEQVTGHAIETLTVAGGGTRNPHWLQIKADVTGCALRVCDQPEVVLLGAALLAGLGGGVYASADDLAAVLGARPATVVQPDPERHRAYSALYEQGYLGMQEALRRFGRFAAGQV